MDISGSLINISLKRIDNTDLDKYQELWAESAYISEFTGVTDLPDSFLENYKNPALPPAGVIDNLFRYEIADKDGNAIGYLEYYEGFIEVSDIYIGFLYIVKKSQGQGYGSQVLDYLKEKTKENGRTKRLLAHVALKNFPAVWFWYREGFKKILDLDGDKIYGSDKYMNMVMQFDVE